MELMGNISFNPSQLQKQSEAKMPIKEKSDRESNDISSSFNMELALASAMGQSSATPFQDLRNEMFDRISQKFEGNSDTDQSEASVSPKGEISQATTAHVVQPEISSELLIKANDSSNTDSEMAGPIFKNGNQEISVKSKENQIVQDPSVHSQDLEKLSFAKRDFSPVPGGLSEREHSLSSQASHQAVQAKPVTTQSTDVSQDTQVQSQIHSLLGSQAATDVTEFEFKPSKKGEKRVSNESPASSSNEVKNESKSFDIIGGADFLKTMQTSKRISPVVGKGEQELTSNTQSQAGNGLDRVDLGTSRLVDSVSSISNKDIKFDVPSVETLAGASFQQAPVKADVMKKFEVTGHVVPGAMAQNRLTSESLMNLSDSVRQLASGKGGEVKIRLKPDSLGELDLRVSTVGNRVGLKINATDESAKSILEESISSLKEKLSSQNLVLSKIDVNVAPSVAKGLQSDFQANVQSQSHSNVDLDQGGNGRGYQEQSSGWEKTERQFSSRANLGAGASIPKAVGSRLANTDGRLNVVA